MLFWLRAASFKCVTFLLSFILIFSSFSLNASAASDGFSTYDMSYQGVAVYIDSNGKTQQVDCTSGCTKTSTTYNSVDCTVFGMGNSSGYVAKSIIAHEITDLNSGHEYNIKFKYNSSLPASTVFVCDLVFYSSSGTELRRQTLFEDFNMSSGWHTVDVDFKPDNSGLNSGYKSKIEFTFTNTSTVLVYFRLSDIVELTDKDDNSNWFQKIINAIKEIPEKLGNLGENIGNWFSNLGDNIGGFFDGLWDKLSNAFSNIGDWFVDLKNALAEKLSELGDKISTKFQEISDNFNAFFEKFKPRVYVKFNWLRGNIDTKTGETSEHLRNTVFVSDFFEVQSSDKYLLDVIDNTSDDIAFNFRIFKYDLNGNYLSFINLSPITGYELDSGFKYRFTYNMSTSVPNNSANDYVLVYADEGWLNAFGHYLLNGLKSLFIPSDDYFDNVLDTFEELYVEHFGIFAQFQVFFEDTLTHFESLLSDDYTFIFPKISVPINGETFTLIEEQTVDMSIWLSGDSWSSRLYKIYRLCASAVIVFAVLQYASKVEHVVLGVNNYDFIVDRM